MSRQEERVRLEALAERVVNDAEAVVRRVRDRAANRGRQVLLDAEAHVEELERAARELGRVRGTATESSFARAADAEIREVVEGAFDRLAERFLTRVGLALASLPKTETYERALSAWARSAAAQMSGPTDVFTAPRDRKAVYEALLEADAEDFHVRLDRTCRAGFVVRDLDGKTVVDVRPEALVERHAATLSAMLRERVPESPTSSSPTPGE